MMTKAGMYKFRQIVVALNSPVEGIKTIEVASMLAAELEAELTGLFVEDINLFNLAELPFAYEVLTAHASRRALNSFQLQRALRAEAEKIQQLLMKNAENRHINCRFSIVRGHVVRETVMAATAEDLLIVSRDNQGSIIGDYSSETVCSIVEQANCPVLITGQKASHQQPIYVIIEDVHDIDHVLAAAVSLAGSSERSISILICGSDHERVDMVERECRSKIGRYKGDVSIESVVNINNLIFKLKHFGAEAVVLRYKTLLHHNIGIDEFLSQIKSPVLLVR